MHDFALFRTFVQNCIQAKKQTRHILNFCLEVKWPYLNQKTLKNTFLLKIQSTVHEEDKVKSCIEN